MHPSINVTQPDLNACVCATRIVVRIARILLVLIGVSLLTMPVTQQMWTWDHFLHGGQDFEMGLLVVLSFLCLVLVLSKHCKEYVDSFFEALRLLSFEFKGRMRARIPVAGASLILRTKCLGNPTLGLYSLPLQI